MKIIFELTDEQVTAVEYIRRMEAEKYLTGVLDGAVQESVVLYKQEYRKPVKEKINLVPDPNMPTVEKAIDDNIPKEKEPEEDVDG